MDFKEIKNTFVLFKYIKHGQTLAQQRLSQSHGIYNFGRAFRHLVNFEFTGWVLYWEVCAV